MSKDQIEILMYLKVMIADLIFVNGVIATELINITENTAAIRHGEEFLSNTSCQSEHLELNKRLIQILKKYQKTPDAIASLEEHVLKHLK
jgi:dihydroorotase